MRHRTIDSVASGSATDLRGAIERLRSTVDTIDRLIDTLERLSVSQKGLATEEGVRRSAARGSVGRAQAAQKIERRRSL